MTDRRRLNRRDAAEPSVLRGRFRIERTLGEGGFGTVFEAHDLLRNARVALKTVHAHAQVQRLKREFRSLAELRHRNLVELFELHGEGVDWFFTMELVDGPSLKEHLGMAPAPLDPSIDTATVSQRTEGAPPPRGASRVVSTIASPRRRADVDKLRHALAQIALGLSHLHRHDTLHLDVKPSNVLVTNDGRVLLADFGLSRPKYAVERSAADEPVLFGTPQYMAPEHTNGGAIGPAADAYSLGVLLYEALTGQLPFSGSTALVLAAKQSRPMSVRAVFDEAPADLATLCDALLDPRPDARATIDDVLAATGERPPIELSTERIELVGRDDERAHLRAMLEATQAGGAPLFAVIDAPSGGGKSALVRAFADDARAAGAVVLQGRCRADEWVEFEAVDAIVDQLTDVLDEVPRDLGLLFPSVVSVHSDPSVSRADARRRGFAAFRAALRALCERGPAVLWIDDAQWGDIDSAALISEALRPPDAPPVLVLCTVRTDAASPMIEAIDATNRERAIAEARITLAPLDAQAAHALLDRVAPTLPAPRRDEIVAASQGNPFFLSALAAEDTLAPSSDVEALLRARIEALEPDARALLSVLSVAGRALPRSALSSIAQIEGLRELHAIAQLRALRMISAFRLDAVEHIDAWHDRVRERAAAMIAPRETRDAHAQIAEYLLHQRETDALAIAHHLACAERPAEAARWAERAGDRAAAHSAFDAAARAYERAIALASPTGEPRRALLTKVGECWALSGRRVLAAHAFEQAATNAAPIDALALRERAAAMLLGAGHIERGLSMMNEVLREVGLSLPGSREAVLARLVWARARLFVRGLRYRPNHERAMSWQKLLRLDALHAVATGLSLVDTIAGSYFSSVHLLEALEAGEPRRIGIALASEQCFLAGRGGLSPKSDERTVAALLSELAEQTDDRDLRARCLFARGTCAFLRAQFDDAARSLEGALALWKDMPGVDHERATSEHFVLAARTWLGQHAAVQRRLPEVLRDARDMGDLYAETTVETAIGHIPSLVRNDPAHADAVLSRSISRWARGGYYIQHYDETVARVDVALYRDHGRGLSALEGVRARWPDLERSLLRQVQLIRVESDYARARAIVSALQVERSQARRAWLRELERIYRAMLGEETSWAIGLARCVGAALAMEREQPALAVSELDRATGALAAAGAESYRAAAGIYRAQLVGDERRAESLRSELRAQGVREPDRFAIAFVPGRR